MTCIPYPDIHSYNTTHWYTNNIKYKKTDRSRGSRQYAGIVRPYKTTDYAQNDDTTPLTLEQLQLYKLGNGDATETISTWAG